MGMLAGAPQRQVVVVAVCKHKQGIEAEVSEKETVLLGLLAEEASHAYGLEEKIRARQMENWTPIGFSSIYRLLSGLEERGFIEGRSEQGGQGASRKVYALTNSGHRVLAEGVLACPRLSERSSSMNSRGWYCCGEKIVKRVRCNAWPENLLADHRRHGQGRW